MTEQTSRVPKFGNWDADEKVPITQMFESARAGKGGELQNEASISRPRHTRRASREDVDLQRLAESAAHRQTVDPYPQPTNSPSQAVSKGGISKTQSDPPRHRRSPSSGYENGTGLVSERVTMGSPYNNPPRGDRSPLHPQAYQAKAVNKVGSASPAWERKGPAEGGTMFSPNTPSRSRPRAGNTLPKIDDSVDKGAALPKFGAWDAKDPTSGEGFTVIFQKARNEKKSGGPVRIPQLQNETPSRDEDLYPKQLNTNHRKSSNRGWFSCFQPTGVEP
ncbi:hypothetical protein O6H91_19G006900 [Diphasiastrum complanatum]|uniref:Uncharacterized protein n=2 Tax=Diphasiastrum complanatum TaxID=34168 RepID=A0ACC2ATV8_DIPCM|nr:hypothetical protein O6H91_19G006900 [Diphasiastrum complanatum]